VAFAQDEILSPELFNWPAPAYYRMADAGVKAQDRAAASAPLSFVAITPCRIADTRGTQGAFGGPALQTGETRTYQILQSACSIPAAAKAYSLNFTVDLTGLPGLPFLAAWPTGEPRPNTSILNAPNPSVQYLANSAVVPAGTNGAINVFASGTTHLIMDVNGYYVEGGGTLPSVIFEDPLSVPPSQTAARNISIRVAPLIRTLDTDSAVTTSPAWSFTAPRSCVYQVSAQVRNPLAMIGYQSLILNAAASGAAPQSVMEAIHHTSQPGVPATVELTTLISLGTGSTMWLDFRQTFADIAQLQSRIAIQCVRQMP
jgi:hypothetical protein